MSEGLILGIDGGGTKTIAWIAFVDNPKKIVGRGISGPSNLQAVGREKAINHLDQAIEAAFADAELPAEQFVAASLGLSGADRPADKTIIEEWAEGRRLADRLRIVNDALPVLYAANPDGYGIALISGTGSFAFGQNQGGTTARAGGWGYLFGDEGSGFVIALDGLRAAAKSVDGRGPATSLLKRLLEAIGGKQPKDLISAIYDASMDRPKIAELAGVVFEADEAGDAVARQILDQAVSCLADMVAAVARQLGFDADPFPLALTGGVLLNYPAFQTRLKTALQDRGLSAEPIELVVDPVAGALNMARELAIG